MFNFFNSSFDDMFGGSFNFKFSNLSDSDYDWEDLKSKGKVEESIEEADGIRTITKTFISTDGKQKITSVSSEPIIDDKKQRLIEIDKEIKNAILKENYEKAAELKKERDILLNPNSNETR